MAPQRENRFKVSALLRAEHKVSEIANIVGLAQPSTRSRSVWTMAKVSTDLQTVIERLLWIVTVFRPLPARLLTSWSSSMRVLFAQTIVRNTPTRFATSLTLCPARRSADTFIQLSVCRAILKYTTITNLFLRCHSNRASSGLNCHSTRNVTKSFAHFFRPTRYSGFSACFNQHYLHSVTWGLN